MKTGMLLDSRGAERSPDNFGEAGYLGLVKIVAAID
jgi:hypothetical protein